MSAPENMEKVEDFSIELDLAAIDLAQAIALKGSALAAVITELQTDEHSWLAKHHSHHSYNTHGTAMW